MTKYIFTTYPHLKQMNKYSKQVAKLLFKKYPQWLPYATVGHYHNDTYLEVAISAPIQSRERDLLIVTYDNRITIHFDWCHTHFGGWTEITLQDAFDDAVQFLEALFREEIVAVGIIEDKPSMGLGFFTFTNIPHPSPDRRTYIRSWKGTFNTNHQLP